MPDRHYRCHGCGKGPRIYEEGQLGPCCDPEGKQVMA